MLYIRQLQRCSSYSAYLIIRMLTTTTISLADEPLTVTTINKSYPAHLRHALIVDLSLLRTAESNKHLASFLGHLRGITPQPIGILQFHDETPTLEVWEALQDLKQVSYLEMISGYSEYCNIGLLDHVGSTWSLQSLVIGGACGEHIKTAHLQTITSLTLDYCCGLIFDLAPATVTSNLKKLIIIENDACDHFIKLQEETCLTNNLSEFKIHSTNGCDFTHQYEKNYFGKALMRCHSLKSLDLTMHDSSDDSPEEHFLTELPNFFSSNLEVLQFRSPPTLANHLSLWHKSLSDPTWLPQLKSIKFILDVCYLGNTIELEKANLAHEQCIQFLNDVVSLRPSVTIINDDVATVTDS